MRKLKINLIIGKKGSHSFSVDTDHLTDSIENIEKEVEKLTKGKGYVLEFVYEENDELIFCNLNAKSFFIKARNWLAI